MLPLFALFQLGEALPVWRSAGMAFLTAIGFVLANVAIGRIAFRLPLLARLEAAPPTRLLFQLLTGTYVSAALLFLMALNGLSAVDATLVVLLCLGALLYDGIAGARVTFGSEFPRDSRRRAMIYLLAAVTLLWLFPFMVRALLPITDWDSLMYHVPLARHIAATGMWTTDPYFSHHNFPAVVHLFYAFFVGLHIPGAIPIFALLLGGMVALVALYELTRTFWGAVAALFAVLLYLTVNVVWTYASTARLDNMQALYFLSGTYALLLFLQRPKERGWLIMAAMSLSMMLGLKYTAAALFVVAVPLAVVGAVRAGLRQSVPFIALSCAVLMFPTAFWYARNWIQLGDPVYPFLLKRLVYIGDTGDRRDFFSDIDRLIAREAPAEPEFRAAVQQLGGGSLLRSDGDEAPARMLLNIWDVITHPSRYAPDASATVPRIVLLFIALPLFLRTRYTWALYYSCVAGFLAVSAGHQTRYLTPVLPLFAAGTGVLLQQLYALFRARSRVLAAAVFSLAGLYLAFGAATVARAEARRARNLRAERYLTGQITPLQVLWGDTARYGKPLASAIEFFNSRSSHPQSDRVMMLIETRCYPLPNPCWGDHPTFNGHRWLSELMNANVDYQKLETRLRQQDVRYILVDSGHLPVIQQQLMEMVSNADPAAPDIHRKRLAWGYYHLHRFLTGHATHVYENSGVSIFELPVARTAGTATR